jgi:hypothetical protein
VARHPPDLLITEHGLSVTELDSVPGGIGLTGWLNQTYSQMGAQVLGGADGMLRGFASIFADAPTVHIVVSEEAATYRPKWCGWPASWVSRFKVQDASSPVADSDAVYRFFELFDGQRAERSDLRAAAEAIRLRRARRCLKRCSRALEPGTCKGVAAGAGRRFLPPAAWPGAYT